MVGIGVGATVCTFKNHRCEVCPLQSLCRAYQFQEQSLFPSKKAPKKWVQVQEKMICLVNEDRQVLLRRRESGEWRSGLWDLLNQRPAVISKAQRIGVVETRHIVTNHKIQRVTEIWKISSARKAKLLQASEPKSSVLRWVSLESPDVAVGSALKRTLLKVEEVLDGAENNRLANYNRIR